MKRAHPVSSQTEAALQVLGVEIARGRRARRWTAAALAERAGISTVTLHNVEQGSATVAIGTVFELATLVGVALFGAADAGALNDLRERSRLQLALLPSRIREPASDDDDNF